MSELIADIDEARCDLAAIFRWAARENMHEGVANHFSYAISDDGQRFLMNPYGKHFSKMCASDLLDIDAREYPSELKGRIDHLHTHYATALSALKSPVLPAIDQTSCRFFNRVAIDDNFGGMGLGDEAERLSGLLGNKIMMMMGNHGFLTVGDTPALAFDLAYSFERACRTYMTALSTGRELAFIPDDVAEKTAQQFASYEGGADIFLTAIRSILDEEEPEYRH